MNPLIHKFLKDHLEKLTLNPNPDAVDCQQLKRTCARSAGCSAACNGFIPTACVRNMMTWGGTWHINLDVGREIATTGHVARIWEEDDSVLA